MTTKRAPTNIMTYIEFLKRTEKGKIEPLYLFYGEEKLLIGDALSRILDRTMVVDSRGFNYDIFDGDKTNISDVLAIAESFPFCSPWRVIQIKDINLMPAEGLELLLQYIKKPSPTTCLILVAAKPDMRKRFFREVKEILSPIQIQPLSGIRLISWIKTKAKCLDFTISDDAISFLIERKGDDLRGILSEIEKLSLYLEEKKVARLEDVKAITCGEETPSIFDLTRSLVEKNAGDSLRLLSLLLISGEPPLVVLSMIVRQFRIIWRIVETKEAGRSVDDLLQEIGIPHGKRDKIIKQSEGYTCRELSRILSLFLKADLELKSSRIVPRIVLEALILKICLPV